MKYTVNMKVEGWLDIDVEADTPEEAREKADKAFAADCDLNRLEYIANDVVKCYDERGNITNY